MESENIENFNDVLLIVSFAPPSASIRCYTVPSRSPYVVAVGLDKEML